MAADLEELMHEASNEASSIAMGVQILRSIEPAKLSRQQQRALQLLQRSSRRLIGILEEIRELHPPGGPADE